MSALIQLGLAIISVSAIVFGAEKVVDKMKAVASYYGVSQVFIAMTIISIGTSLPEISLHVIGSFNILSNPSSLNSVSGTVLGMNIGSDVVQQTLIMGSTVFLAFFMAGKDKMVFSRKFIKRNYIPMVLAHLLVLVFAYNLVLGRLEGILLVSIFMAYIFYLYRKKDERLVSAERVEPSKKPLQDLSIGLLAMFALIYFSDVFLGVVENLIVSTGLSGSMIGVMLVGFVSAVPEFTTALSGLRKNAGGISLGTLIGSNITNPLLGIGVGASISTYSVPTPLVMWDLPVQILTATTLVVYLWNRKTVGKNLANILNRIGLEKQGSKIKEMENGVLTAVGGLILVLVYLLYIAVRVLFFSVDFA